MWVVGRAGGCRQSTEGEQRFSLGITSAELSSKLERASLKHQMGLCSKNNKQFDSSYSL